MIDRLKAFLQHYRFFFYMAFFSFYRRCLPLKPNQVLLFSDSRATLSGNLLFIRNELTNYPYEVQWVLKGGFKKRRPIRDWFRLPYLLAVSKYIVVDDFCPVIYPLHFRSEQKVIQAWHAIGALKKVGFSREGLPGGPIAHSITHRNYTDTIVSAPTLVKNYAEAFHIAPKKVHVIGAPRTDIFFNRNFLQSARENFFRIHPDWRGKKIVLFCPTFRGRGPKDAYYNLDWIDFTGLKQKLGDGYRMIVKLHPFVRQRPYFSERESFYLDLSDHREINTLLPVIDVLITDYSSVIFENALLRKAAVYFVPDLDNYRHTRDFYYPFDKYIYGPLVHNWRQLAEAIPTAKANDPRLDDFLNFFCRACDGRQSRRFVRELILENRS